MNVPGLPERQGLYDPQLEKDGCGIGFVADLKGRTSHTIVQQGLEVLTNLAHRGAQGCDPCTGDGAGILFQVPHAFLRRASSWMALPTKPDRPRQNRAPQWTR